VDDDGSFHSGPLSLRDAALFTDLYELTMAASYFREGMNEPATFSLFVRRLPPTRSFLLAAGLDDVLGFLEGFRFSARAVEYLDSLGLFEPRFLEFLAGLRFTGSVRALPEGTVLFADEPILEVTAPLIEAQVVETALLNFCHLQTLLASKAVRPVLAARGRPVIDFGLRRTHGIGAGLKAARCTFIAGMTMSSHVLAGLEYGIPPTGTMAHSYVKAFESEVEAFRAFARTFGERTVLLIDTYDTLSGARKAVVVGREMEALGKPIRGVRLDSGDLVALSKGVRRILDEGGLRHVRIMASGGLDEDSIEHCLAEGAPIDAFAVGTRINVSADAPYLDMAYKLVEYAGRGVVKLSTGKETWPGRKQVYRARGGDGRFAGDVLALVDEPAPAAAEPLLEVVMRAGKRVAPSVPLAAIREHCAAQIAALPDAVKRLRGAAPYPVRYSDRLQEEQRAVEADVALAEGGAERTS
jgi:nicotinate phosphoribosyltransferase